MSDQTAGSAIRGKRVAAFAGSLRSGSFNRAALKTAIVNAPAGLEIVPVDVSDVPFFDGDVENAGDPSSVRRVKEAVRSTDGLVVFTPEYNGSVSAVTKNVIDWLSRSTGDAGSPIAGKPVAVAAVSPGGRAGPGAREHLLHVVNFMSDAVFAESLGIGGVMDKVDEDGEISDAETVNDIAAWLGRFSDHIDGVRHQSGAA